MLQGYIANKWGNKMFEDDMAKIVKKHAFWGAVIMALPTFGFGLVVYCLILWHMYSALCEKCNTKLRISTVIVGIIVNFAITSICISTCFRVAWYRIRCISSILFIWKGIHRNVKKFGFINFV